MIKQFERDLKGGLGRAYMTLQATDDHMQYFNIIEKVMLNYTDYDFQSEGTRGRYFANIIHLINREDYFVEHISQKLFDVKVKSHQLKSHLLDIIYALALDCNEQAKVVHEQFYDFIYDRIFQVRIKEGKYYDEFSCYFDIVCQLAEFNGFDFVKKVVKDISMLSPECKNRVDEFLFDVLAEKYSNNKINELLVKYQINYQVEKRKYKKIKREPISLEQFVNGFDEPKKWKKRELIRRFSRSKKDDLQALVKLFEDEESIEKRSYYLQVFETIKYPGNIDILIDQFHLYDDQYDELLLKVLVKIKSKKVEKFAIKILTEHKIEALLILSNNLNAKNIDLFLKTLKTIDFYKKTAKSDQYHFFLSDLVELIYKNEMIETKVLIDLFHAQQCSFCRYYIARRILESRTVDLTFIEELKYDCYEDTASLLINLNR